MFTPCMKNKIDSHVKNTDVITVEHWWAGQRDMEIFKYKGEPCEFDNSVGHDSIFSLGT